MTSDLHRKLEAKIDLTEKLANRTNRYDRSVHNLVAVVLAGIAEDRDILRRHAPALHPDYHVEFCDDCERQCHSRSGLMCDQPDVPWPCDWIRSLARRHGIEVEG